MLRPWRAMASPAGVRTYDRDPQRFCLRAKLYGYHGRR